MSEWSFSIIKHYKNPNNAVTVDGKEVTRQDKVWIDEPDGSGGRFVSCSPDDVHFVYIDPMWETIQGRWFAMCTCGSPAVIIGSNTYKHLSSPTTFETSTRPGEMLICMYFMEFGKHTDETGVH